MAKVTISSFNAGRTTFFVIPSFKSPSLRRYNSNPPFSSSSSSLLIRCRAADQIYKKSDYWDNIETEIQLHLKKSIPPITHPVLDAVVFEPMHHLTIAAPALCIASWELVAGGDTTTRYSNNPAAAMAAASAIHLVHATSYIHENINQSVLMTTRKFPQNIELLTGDGILPFGFELLAKSMKEELCSAQKNNNDKEEEEEVLSLGERILRVIVEISRVSGSEGMMKMKEKKNKEGELHACGAACGAILGGGSEEEIEKLRKYGFYAGMIQALVHGNGNNSNTELMEVKKYRDLAMEQLASFRATNTSNKYIYDILYN